MMFLGKTAKLIRACLVGLAVAIPRPSVNARHYNKEDIITRDVYIIGVGSTGTYSAISLECFNKSVVVVEMKGRPGGHTENFHPATKILVDIGVEIFHNPSIETEYFARFNVPLITTVFPPIPQQWVDFRTGKVVANYTSANDTALGTALAEYTTNF
jgi:phytoene dehydrogenase-like protein